MSKVGFGNITSEETATNIMANHFITLDENNYLHLLCRVIQRGAKVEDRTGVGTRTVMGASLSFNLSGRSGEMIIPLLTTKKVYWKAIVEELLWFMRGATDSKQLEAKGVNIWKGNTSKEFLESRGLGFYPEGEIGPGYGFQWRNWNGNYNLWMNEGVWTGLDQFKGMIDSMRDNPTSRRHMMIAWNPVQIHEMALPPCHVLFQCQVANGVLNTVMYQRSCDLFLGVPFNIASYSLLTHILAKTLGLRAGTFTWLGGDVHLYENHIDAAAEQIRRDPTGFPTIEFVDYDFDPNKVPDDLTFDNFVLKDYNPQPAIKAPMAV